MTFSLVGMCRRTGMLGAAVTTSSIGVGSRCPYARAGAGAVLTQHRTDPTLGPAGLDLLEAGRSAQETVDALVDGNPTIGWRQLAVIDSEGRTAFFHGERIISVHNAARGTSSCAIGNIVRNDGVPRAMVDAYEAAPDEHLAERLMRGLEAGEAVLFVTLFRSGFLGLFLIGRGSISHIVPPLSESRCGADWGRRPPW